MIKLRALMSREGNLSVATCLEHFVVGEGPSDKEALESLAIQLATHQQMRDLEHLPIAPEEYQKRYSASVRQTVTMRLGFVLHLRTG